MNITIFGAGGVGGYFGGLLAKAGHEVAFIARGAHLEAIQNRGLEVKSVHGDFVIKPAIAAEDPFEIGPAEYLIVAVKHYHLPAIATTLGPLVGPDTTVVPLLNGVDAHEHLIHALGPDGVVGGLTSIVSMIEAPGVIRQMSDMRRIWVGELDRTNSERVARLVQAWGDCGVEAFQPDDIHVAMWNKYLFISSFGGITSLTRSNAGEILTCPETRTLFIHAMQEVEQVGRARGIALPEDAIEKALAMADSFEPSATSSMQRDVASGRPFELEAFSGTITQLGREAGVATPIHDAVYALLLPALRRAQASG